jgi:hypothetical protein
MKTSVSYEYVRKSKTEGEVQRAWIADAYIRGLSLATVKNVIEQWKEGYVSLLVSSEDVKQY